MFDASIMQRTQKQIYTELRSRIMDHRFKPGTSLNLREIAEEMHVSSTPIRDAILQLEQDGLVNRIPNSTAVVADVSFRELQDAFSLRLHLMGLVAKLAVQRIHPHQVELLDQIVHRINDSTDRSETIRLDEEFHEALNDIAGNTLLAKSLRIARTRLRRIWVEDSQIESTASRHARSRNLSNVVDALRTKDVRACQSALSEHAMGFVSTVRAALLEIGTTEPPSSI